MAAKKKIAPPKPRPDRTWSELTKAEQNAEYASALLAYARGEGPNPSTSGAFNRARKETAGIAPAVSVSRP